MFISHSLETYNGRRYQYYSRFDISRFLFAHLPQSYGDWLVDGVVVEEPSRKEHGKALNYEASKYGLHGLKWEWRRIYF